MSTLLFSDPGDAFAQAFLALAGESDTVLDGLDAQVGTGLALLIDNVVDQVTSQGVLKRFAPPNRAAWYGVLIGLDRVLGTLDPARSAIRVPAPLQSLRARLVDTGRIDSGLLAGAVLSRCATPGRPGSELDGLAGRLGSLLYVPAAEWQAVDLWRPRRDLPKPAASTRLPVAAVPYFGERSDVSATRRASGSQLRYSIEPASGLDRRRRVERTLTALEGSGAVLGLVPEATLDAVTLDEWRAGLAASPGYGTLKWLLIGTGAVDATVEVSRRLSASSSTWTPTTPGARNRAVLMDRDGRVVLTQDKQHGFTMVASTVRNWGLDGQLPARNMNEWLDSARTLQVLETSRGRLAILICEDLTRASTVGRVAAAIGVSLAIAPIFGAVITGPTTAREGKGPEWPQLAATELATDIGTRTAALNSMAITRVFLGSSDPTVTLFTMRPDPAHQSYWTEYLAGSPVGVVDTTALSAEDDAVTARVAEL